MRAEAPPCGGSQNLQIPVLNGARPADFGTRIFAPPVDRVGQKAGAGNLCRTKTVSWLRLAQFCELQNRQKTSNRTTTRKQLFLINPPAPLRRQRTAESTCTTLVQAVACTTPGVKLPKAKIIKTERTPTEEHLRLKSCRQAKTPYDRPSPSPAKSAARGIDKSSNLPFRRTFYTIGSSISVIFITQMDFLIINSVQNLRGGDFLYLCIVRTARWTFGHWDEDATHILRGTARPLVGRCFS